MKNTGIALFELIHSLSMTEKKYFKMFSSIKGGDKSYLQLYDAIEKQRTYNEGAIRSYRGKELLQQFPVTKNRLYNNILRSLEIQHRSADINLRRQINKAKILLGKGLTAQALKLLKGAKLLAYGHEQWGLLIEILDMGGTPYAELEPMKMPHLNEETEAVLKKLNNINDYRKLHHKISHRSHKAEPMRTRKELLRVEKLMRHPLLRNSKQACCTEAKAYYYEIWSLYYFFHRDAIKGCEISKEQCAFIETHLHQLRDPDKRYLFALNISAIFIGYLLPSNRNKYGEMQKVLQKIRAYPIASHTLKATSWTKAYINELNALILIGDFEKIVPVLKAIEGNENLLNQAPAVLRINLYYNIAYMLFGSGNYNEALSWIRKIIDRPARTFRQDTQALAHILSLIAHYELHKDEELLDSLKRSAMHFLSTRHRLFKVEKALMHCMGQIMGKSIDRKKRSAAFQELKTNLLKLMKDPMEKAVMEEFDFLSWVESKIENKTFAEVVRQKADRTDL